jgi:uncharacterized membrane protein
MSDRLYKVQNFVIPTTGSPARQNTGTAVRTMLQIATLAAQGIKIKEWGISFYGSTAGAAVTVEFFGTTVAATTLTALASTDICEVSEPGAAEVPALQYGAALTGFNTAGAGTENTVANYRSIDVQGVPMTGSFSKQWPLGSEPYIAGGAFGRIRVLSPVDVPCHCYVDFVNA